MITKGLGKYHNMLLKGLASWWQVILLTLKDRLFGLSLSVRNFVLSTHPWESGQLSLPKRNLSLNLGARSFTLTLPKLEE